MNGMGKGELFELARCMGNCGGGLGGERVYEAIDISGV